MRAGDEGGIVTGKKSNSRRHLRRVGGALPDMLGTHVRHRSGLFPRKTQLLRELYLRGAPDRSGTNGVDPDTLLPQLEREIARQSHNRRLRDVVQKESLLRD